MKIINLKTESIVEYAKNPRKNNHAIDALAKMISEYGFRVPLLVKGNELVDGHLRLKAARKLGLKELPCHDVSDLTDGQIKALRIAINRSAELADWDLELLADEIGDLRLDDDFDLGLIGFDDESLNILFENEAEKYGESIVSINENKELDLNDFDKVECLIKLKYNAQDYEQITNAIKNSGKNPETIFYEAILSL